MTYSLITMNKHLVVLFDSLPPDHQLTNFELEKTKYHYLINIFILTMGQMAMCNAKGDKPTKNSPPSSELYSILAPFS